MNKRYSALRASLITSLAFALAAPLGVAWAQPQDHQHDSHAGGPGHPGAPAHGGTQAPRGPGAPAPHTGGGAPNGGAGHFTVAPRFHAPPAHGGNAPAQNVRPEVRPAPQASPGHVGGGPGFHGSAGERGGPLNAHGPANGFAGRPPTGHGNSGQQFANGGHDAGHGERGFVPNHDRGGDFQAARDHDRGPAFGRPEARHYDRDHWENHRHWEGGYWNGRFWPAIHDGPNFVWLLLALPVGYVTYAWDGVPYYYYNDTYYTWDPAYNGYVATEPPPVADSGPPPDESQAQPNASGADSGSQLYAYPTRGQTPEQQAQDRQECQQWAGSQSPPADDDGYQRALKACLMGRGYTVQ